MLQQKYIYLYEQTGEVVFLVKQCRSLAEHQLFVQTDSHDREYTEKGRNEERVSKAE